MPSEIERSHQDIPLSEGEASLLAMSRPLHELADAAPVIPTSPVLDIESVGYPFSNDDSVAYYEQTQARTMTPEYRDATNRTAVIVGEGSLMGTLRMIPEDTIILLDNSPEMCEFMGRYVEALREAETPDEWGEMMGLKEEGGDDVPDDAARAVRRLRRQLIAWQDEGYKHPIDDNEAFEEASKLARRKAIIPWLADLTSKEDLARLGSTLREHGASVTMLNITNALAGQSVYVEDASKQAERLEALPLTPNAPILATSFLPKLPAPVGGAPRAMATGPFFGLRNLAESGDTGFEHFMHQDAARLASGQLGTNL